jgi:hypothetical protein
MKHGPLHRFQQFSGSTQPGGPYTVIAAGILLPEYYNTQIKAEITYYYVVSAVNELGESPDSTEARAQP